jgi:Ca2+-binding EF-hand superfamily protein
LPTCARLLRAARGDLLEVHQGLLLDFCAHDDTTHDTAAMPPKQMRQGDFEAMLSSMDKDGDSRVDKAEFKVPYMKMNKGTTDEEYEKVWKSIDKDGNGILSVDELCSFFNVKLSPGFGKDSNVEMSDDDIMKALQMQAALAEAEAEREARDAERKSKAEEKVHGKKTSSDRRKKNSSGVETVKMATKVTAKGGVDPLVTFLEACELGDAEDFKLAMKELNEKKLSARVEDDKGENPIHKLARHGMKKEIRELLERCEKEDAGTAKGLAREDLNWQNKEGKTPLMLACQYGHAELVEMMCTRGADLLVTTALGATCLHEAVVSRSDKKKDVVTILIAQAEKNQMKKAFLNAADKTERRAIHAVMTTAGVAESDDIVKLLIDAGADLEAVDSAGNSATALASKTGRKKSKELLEEALK